MRHPRLTLKDKQLIFSSLRRVFSRSEYRRQLIRMNEVQHTDSRRSRVGRWAFCSLCGQVIPAYILQADHILPLVDLTESANDMLNRVSGADELIDLIWCDPANIQPICKDPCHRLKSAKENRIRRRNKKETRK